MKMKLALIIIAISVIIAVVVFAVKTSRGSYESAAYTVVKTSGDFEIRDYEAHTLVITPLSEEAEKSRDQGFSRLFKYISGQNVKEQKIAMTTPVFMDEVSTMAFVIPSDVEAPAASVEDVRVEKVGPQRYATLRFDGYKDPRKVSEAKKSLINIVTAEGMEIVGEVREAYYDPPWTPGFLRRNEVLVPVSTE